MPDSQQTHARADRGERPGYERIRHHFTVDVEEAFQVSALAPFVERTMWDRMPSRVEHGVDVLLELLEEHGARGTFFVLGWVGERNRALVRRIAAAGHEIASHGWGHERVTDLAPEEFRESVRSSKALLEETIGGAVLGYRAPSFSITRGGEWALDTLVEEGYIYDSSLFPVRRSGYGYAGGDRDPHALLRASGPLHEFPPTTRQIGGMTLPAAGGAYFRHLPYALVSSALMESERRGAPGTFYIHNWEVDLGQPRLPVPYTTRLRHYGGLKRTVPRLRRMLTQFRFQPIADTLAQSGILTREPPFPPIR